jgi:hypothetical protein
LKKILITIQGKTLILAYQVKHGLMRHNAALAAYIEVLPSDELLRFDLKGLSPEMFCVNIADMVNIRKIFSGQVENERQIPVARWLINHEEYRSAITAPPANLSHLQIVNLLASLPGYLRASSGQYIEFEESVVPRGLTDHLSYGGYRLTIATENLEGESSTDAYYSLDTRTETGWQGYPPPHAEHEAIHHAVLSKLQLIKETGVMIKRVHDETDYALAR